ncbi:sensor histidine kinase [Faecalispora anaeroviscerum]|uniref:sensor histidine kinase n=1 Tax=Faecalispora anaeroviscerum TaxID=2991836 RepID=UPI0024BB8E74|nr:histidine kinase [Faecalispora anaeroviscerum]
MIHHFRSMSLRNRIILLSVALSVTVSGIFSVSYYRNISRDLEQSLSDHAMSLSFQISKYMDERLRSIINRVYTLVSGPSYTTTLREYLLGNNEYQYALTMTRINGFISEIKMSDPFISSVYVYTPKGTFYDLASYPKIGFDFLKSDLYREYLQNGGPTLYKSAKRQDEIFKGDKYVIPLVVRVNISGYFGEVYLIINIDSNEMDKYLSKSIIGGEDVVVVDMEKRLIASNRDVDTQAYLESLTIHPKLSHWNENNRDYIVSADCLDTSNWVVVVFSDKSQNNAALGSSRYLVACLILLSALIAGAFSLFFSIRIIRPLEQLQQSMLAVTKGDFTRRYEYSYNNEVGRLARCFNDMVEKLGNLVCELNLTIEQLKVEKENVKREQTLKRKAELNALQAQIDPHFLHNTLNSIIWLAEEGKSEEISTLSAELARFYEYRIRGTKSVICIHDEIEQVKSYLAIQRIRYGNSISYYFELDERLMDRLILKLVLQPLVENAIFHGVQSSDRPQKDISIRVREDEQTNIVLEVRDNGAGIEPEQLKKINEQLSVCSFVPKDGYGIYNVNERIKLYFGEEYGLLYESEAGKWTKAILRIPQWEPPEPPNSEENFDG